MRMVLVCLVASLSIAHAQSDALDRAAITEGIAKVKPKVTACGDTHRAGGKVKVRVTVAPDGKVSAASHEGTDEKLGACVVAAIKTATFKKTAQGGSFSYPFVFGSTTPPSKPPTNQPPPSKRPAPSADALDRAAISEGVANVKSKIKECGKASPNAKGKVKLAVTVAPSGSVTTARVDATPEEKLGTCVAGVMQRATFKATAEGGSFSYPFVF